jgi:hypothetical protein
MASSVITPPGTAPVGVRRPVINPSPRQRFQSLPGILNPHREMVSSDIFRVAADHAMLQYQADIAEQTRDGNSAVAAAYRLLGAQEFLQTLRLLAEMPRPVPVAADHNLNPEA